MPSRRAPSLPPRRYAPARTSAAVHSARRHRRILPRAAPKLRSVLWNTAAPTPARRSQRPLIRYPFVAHINRARTGARPPALWRNRRRNPHPIRRARRRTERAIRRQPRSRPAARPRGGASQGRRTPQLRQSRRPPHMRAAARPVPSARRQARLRERSTPSRATTGARAAKPARTMAAQHRAYDARLIPARRPAALSHSASRAAVPPIPNAPLRRNSALRRPIRRQYRRRQHHRGLRQRRLARHNDIHLGPLPPNRILPQSRRRQVRRLHAARRTRRAVGRVEHRPDRLQQRRLCGCSDYARRLDAPARADANVPAAKR